MSGLRAGEGLDVRMCLVVSWKKIGWYRREVDGSVKSCFLSVLGVCEVVFICFNSAFIAFLSYIISIYSFQRGRRKIPALCPSRPFSVRKKGIDTKIFF